MYISINMKTTRDYQSRLLPLAGWLNRERWRGGEFLPDGSSLDLCQEPKEIVERVRQCIVDVIAEKWDIPRWRKAHLADWEELCRCLALYRLVPVLDHNGQLFDYFEPAALATPLLAPHWWAFYDLLQNPERERLGRCERCQRFYVSSGRYTRKKFCSQQCARYNAATRYKRKLDRKLRESKLRLARRTLHRWKPRHGDWKRWLVRATKHSRTPLTLRFISRASNRGDLKEKDFFKSLKGAKRHG